MSVTEWLQAAQALTHRPLLSTLEQKVRPEHTALVIIDMQNDFCADGGLVSKDGRDISEAQKMALRLPRLIAAARAAGVLPVFVRCEYTSDGNAYLSDVWLEQAVRERKGGFTSLPVCAKDSWEADWYAGISPEPGEIVVVKNRYDAFQGTNLDLVLRSHGIRTLVMTGVVTNVCVETTARAGFVHDYYIAVVEDGCAAYVPEDHLQTLRNIRRFFGVTPTIDELCALWSASPGRQRGLRADPEVR